MAIINPSHVSEIEFDQDDLHVFNIEDVKQRAIAMRSQFFPRLELLRKESLELAASVYGIDPLEGMGSISSPNNRQDATKNRGAENVRVGISGKRRDKNDSPLSIKNSNGKPIYIHPSMLGFDIYPGEETCITINFSPFSFSVEKAFAEKIYVEMQSNFDLLNKILTSIEVCYSLPNYDYSNDFHDLINTKKFNLLNKKTIKNTLLFVDPYYFLVNFNEGLGTLKIAFVGLYPLLHLSVSIAEGRETKFSTMLEKFYEWYSQEEQNENENLSDSLNVTESKEISDDLDKNHWILADREEIEAELNFDPQNIKDARKRTMKEIVQRQGQPKFRSELLEAYDRRCAITGCDAEAALEAAHIIPYLGAQTNYVANGLILRADIHTLFDLHLISINPTTKQVFVSQDLLDTCYKEIDGIFIRLPEDTSAVPSFEALEQHYNNFLKLSS
ncbi:HNH endonuclease [Synechocystis sp. PCC 7338]|uniref:HNH endonuclease n=1 Tax=Synechocystis sp. PCC 7338 TaxID=2732530 RepID=UPI001BB06F6E|nr:HNH endonuclease [Synechocystis sp. PCC 7338]QUS60257.1 HNH endonuclease [Synechocystis sp. PCC 7338]